MARLKLSTWLSLLGDYTRATGLVLALTFLMLVAGRETLGQAVVAMFYLALIAWITVRWGQWSGICSAFIAFLTFNFFFIPPFYTFTVGSLEGWLVLAIFLAVAVLVVGRIQTGLARAQASEREALFMYELSAALAGMRTQAAVAHAVAWQFGQMFQAELVRVIVHAESEAAAILAQEPFGREAPSDRRPERVLPILNAWGLVGEVQVWRGLVELPPADGRLLRNFASQAGQALERTRLAETEQTGRGVHLPAPGAQAQVNAHAAAGRGVQVNAPTPGEN
jgi:two-component system sensor histidine kinase KdpD